MRLGRPLIIGALAWLILAGCIGWILHGIARAGPDIGPGPRPTPIALRPGIIVEQSFFMPPREFSRITLRLDRPGPVEAAIRVTIDRMKGPESTLAEPLLTGVIDLRMVTDDRPALAFPPIPRASDQVYRLRLELGDGSREPVTLLANARSNYRRGILRVAGREQWGDLVFSAGSRSGTWLHSLGLLQHGVPERLRSGVAVVMLLAIFVTAAAAAVAMAVRRGAPQAESQQVARRSGAIVLALYAAGAGLWLLVTPPFEAPDEASHYDFVRYIALNHRLPREVPADRSAWYDTEWFQPPLYYALMSPVAAALDPLQAWPLQERNPRAQMYGGREKTQYAHAEPPHPAFTRLLFALRLASVLFGAATVWLLFRLIERVTGSCRAAMLACTGLLLVPQFTAMSAVVNNDVLATLLAVAASCLILTGYSLDTGCEKPGAEISRAALVRSILIGVISGLAIATKLSTAFLVPMMGVALITSCRRRLGRLLADGAACSASLAIACGWVFARNWIDFGDPLAREFTIRIAAPLQAPQYHRLSDPFFTRQLPDYLYRTFWARVGWTSIGPPETSWVWSLYAAVTIALVAALAGFVLRLVAGRLQPRDARLGAVAVTALALNLAAFLWYASIWSANQARYFYPTLGAVLVAMVAAIDPLVRWIRRRQQALDGLLVAGLYTALAAAWLVAFRDAILGFHFGLSSGL